MQLNTIQEFDITKQQQPEKKEIAKDNISKVKLSLDTLITEKDMKALVSIYEEVFVNLIYGKITIFF